MGRRWSCRLWYAIAALLPPPLLGLGYVAAIPGNQLAFQLELLLSGHGSAHALSAAVSEGSQPHKPLSSHAAQLFEKGGKGPRADYYEPLSLAASAKHAELVTASLTGAPDLGMGHALSRSGKSDRLSPKVTEIALRGTLDDYGVTPELFTGTPFKTTFRNPFEVYDGMVQNLVYKPSEEALKFTYRGESMAEFQERERRCLATAIYFEARGEPVRGQLAVAQVIMNRVRSPMFPDTICGVVYQGQYQKSCQFSFTCDGRSDTPRNDGQWALAQDLARQVTSGQVWLPEVGYSTFYHANYVKPGWSSMMRRIDTIGRHIFYKKRNEEPYVVQEASASPVAPASLPSIAGVSTSITGSVSTSQPAPTFSLVSSSRSLSPNLAPSLGFSASE